MASVFNPISVMTTMIDSEGTAEASANGRRSAPARAERYTRTTGAPRMNRNSSTKVGSISMVVEVGDERRDVEA